jgi:hypothetical protein
MPTIQENPGGVPIAKLLGQQHGTRPEGVRISNRPFLAGQGFYLLGFRLLPKFSWTGVILLIFIVYFAYDF